MLSSAIPLCEGLLIHTLDVVEGGSDTIFHNSHRRCGNMIASEVICLVSRYLLLGVTTVNSRSHFGGCLDCDNKQVRVDTVRMKI